MTRIPSASETNQGRSTTKNLALLLVCLCLIWVDRSYCLYLRCDSQYGQGSKVHPSSIHFPTEEELQSFHRERFSPKPKKEELCRLSDDSQLVNYYFHEETRRCYKRGTQGPCGPELRFGPIPDSDDLNGECYCAESKEARTLIYDPVTHRCFPIFSQGPCDPNEWVTLDPHKGKYQCQVNPCLPISFNSRHGDRGGSGDDEDSQSELVLLNGRCVRLGTSPPECEPSSEVVRFMPGIVLPVCMPADFDPSPSRVFGALARRRCKAGTSMSPTGKCVKNYFFWW